MNPNSKNLESKENAMQPKQQITKRWGSMNRTWLGVAAAGTGLLVGISLSSGAAQARWDANRDCDEVAQSQLQGCRNSAQETYWIAIARCDNDAAEDPSGLCPRAAAQELSAERADCDEQLDARREVCDQLGGGKFNPVIDPANFSTRIDNPYFPLEPGTTFIYEGDTAEGFEHVEFRVTRKTRTLLGVKCVEVRDTSTVDGEVTEDTLDWFAQDKAGNVWYFGEESKQYEDGVLVAVDGSWRAGVEEAKPGIVMEANPQAGDVYRQEYAISEAEDSAEVVALGQTVSYGHTVKHDALQTHEFSGLEPSASEQKFYVPNLGFVLSVDDETGERSELVGIRTH
jgi:hypothetical protein